MVVNKAFLATMARTFVASTWYNTDGLTKRGKLYAKCRELVSGDRVELELYKEANDEC